MSKLFFSCLVALIIGGINWALVGLFGFDLVAFVFTKLPILGRIVYIIIGVAAIGAIASAPRTIA